MDDRELLQLTRMALEAEDLGAEGAGAPPRLRLAGAPGAHVRAFRFAGGLIAAAAGLALAVVIMAPRPAPQSPPIAALGAGGERGATGVLGAGPAVPGEAAGGPEIASVAADEEPGEGCVLLAYFRNSDGSCDCKAFRRPKWERGMRLADLGRKELLEEVMDSSCTTGAERAVIVAVAGPPEVLPSAAEAAERVASRLLSAPPTWNEDITPYAAAAMPDLPPSTTVRACSIAMNR